ncbi:MAG TPA: S53 family peptidase, partial [Pirellulales bacterium]
MFRLRSRRRPSRVKPRGGRRLRHLEPLESRALLSAISIVDSILAHPAIDPLAVTNPTPRGYTPAQVKQLYSFSGVTFNGSIQGDGTGQTIAIVDAYNDPNIASDVHVFDTTFGLPDPKLTVVNQTGGTRLPATDAGWSEEIALDVEWAHAMAPGAGIVLVEANSSSISDLMAAVNTARSYAGVSVVSMSWGSGEFSSERQYDQYFTTPAGHTGVTFVASAGDNGAQAMWPAVSPNVMSVGGTTLSSSGSETAWSGSGGGYSRFETEPSFQRTVQTTGVRSSPDVSYNANPNTGFAVYDTVAAGGRTG